VPGRFTRGCRVQCRIDACSVAFQDCRLNASDGFAYYSLSPRFVSSEQKKLQLQEQPGVSTGARSSSSAITASPITVSDSLFSSLLYMRELLAVKALPVRQEKSTEYVKTATQAGKELK